MARTKAVLGAGAREERGQVFNIKALNFKT
jgi:hypothetical protein